MYLGSGAKPCSNCREHKTECFFPPATQRHPPRRRRAEELERRFSQLEAAIYGPQADVVTTASPNENWLPLRSVPTANAPNDPHAPPMFLVPVDDQACDFPQHSRLESGHTGPTIGIFPPTGPQHLPSRSASSRETPPRPMRPLAAIQASPRPQACTVSGRENKSSKDLVTGWLRLAPDPDPRAANFVAC
jgi:hypothetical protein